MAFFENCYCYLNLVFFCVFHNKTKLGTKRVFLFFMFSLFLRTGNGFQKQKLERPLDFSIF